jgi:hypothetical protein
VKGKSAIKMNGSVNNVDVLVESWLVGIYERAVIYKFRLQDFARWVSVSDGETAPSCDGKLGTTLTTALM